MNKRDIELRLDDKDLHAQALARCGVPEAELVADMESKDAKYPSLPDWDDNYHAEVQLGDTKHLLDIYSTACYNFTLDDLRDSIRVISEGFPRYDESIGYLFPELDLTVDDQPSKSCTTGYIDFQWGGRWFDIYHILDRSRPFLHEADTEFILNPSLYIREMLKECRNKLGGSLFVDTVRVMEKPDVRMFQQAWGRFLHGSWKISVSISQQES